jgi:hypothetical protein
MQDCAMETVCVSLELHLVGSSSESGAHTDQTLDMKMLYLARTIQFGVRPLQVRAHTTLALLAKLWPEAVAESLLPQLVPFWRLHRGHAEIESDSRKLLVTLIDRAPESLAPHAAALRDHFAPAAEAFPERALELKRILDFCNAEACCC